MASLLPRQAAAFASRRLLLLLRPPAVPVPVPVRSGSGSGALPGGLVRRGGLVGGRWLEAPAAFGVRDPASGQELGPVADCGAAEAREAVRAAHAAGAAWGRLAAKVSGGPGAGSAVGERARAGEPRRGTAQPCVPAGEERPPPQVVRADGGEEGRAGRDHHGGERERGTEGGKERGSRAAPQLWCCTAERFWSSP